MATGNRIVYIDALKLFAIFSVLWGHSIQYLITDEYYLQPVYRFIYAFHMPLFMALSGYVVSNSNASGLWNFLIKKGRQLLLPLVSAVGVYYLVVKFSHIPHDNFITMVGVMLWFLKSAFVCAILYRLSSKCGRYFKYVCIITVLILICMMPCGAGYLDRLKLDIMYPSFLLGVGLRRYSTWINTHLFKVCIIAGGIFLCMLVKWDAGFWAESGHVLIAQSELLNRLYLQLYRIAIGLAGTLFFMTLFEWIAAKVPGSKFGYMICSLGSYTLGVYILQTFLLEIAMPQLLNFDNQNRLAFVFITAPIISIGVMAVCLIGVKILRLFKITSFMFLGIPFSNIKN